MIAMVYSSCRTKYVSLLEQVQLRQQFLDLAAYLLVLLPEIPALKQHFLIDAPIPRKTLIMIGTVIERLPPTLSFDQQL